MKSTDKFQYSNCDVWNDYLETWVRGRYVRTRPDGQHVIQMNTRGACTRRLRGADQVRLDPSVQLVHPEFSEDYLRRYVKKVS
jgi:hypothetical protein